MSLASATDSSLENLLTSLEKTIERLADGTAPLEELVSAHERALKLLAEAEQRLDMLKSKAEALSSQLRE